MNLLRKNNALPGPSQEWALGELFHLGLLKSECFFHLNVKFLFLFFEGVSEYFTRHQQIGGDLFLSTYTSQLSLG
jgi:hypothetical protein